MKILVDGKRQDLRPLPKTIGETIAALRTAVGKGGRIVIAVSVDGRQLNEEEESVIAAEPVGKAGEIEVKTADPRALCLSTLDEVGRHIQPIIDECGRIAGLIDTGKELAALERILPCIEVWGTILSTVQKISVLMQIDMNGIATDKEALSDGINALVRLLQSLKVAIDAHDIVSVRDTMKYEMPGIAERIAKQITALSSVISAK